MGNERLKKKSVRNEESIKSGKILIIYLKWTQSTDSHHSNCLTKIVTLISLRAYV